MPGGVNAGVGTVADPSERRLNQLNYVHVAEISGGGPIMSSRFGGRFRRLTLIPSLIVLTLSFFQVIALDSGFTPAMAQEQSAPVYP